MARAALAFLCLAGCVQYRTYPLLSLEPAESERALELSGVARLPSGKLVLVAEGKTTALYVPAPDAPLQPGALLDLLPLRDGRDVCGSGTPRMQLRCAVRNFRAEVRLVPQPIEWLEREHPLRDPFDVEDLAPFGPERVLGVSKYTTVGRRTAFRRDGVVRTRLETERLFALERREGVWYELELPEIERLQDSLSDWGRANCEDDLQVSGLAWDEASGDVYVGLARCAGPALRALRYNLARAKAGEAVGLSVAVDGSATAELGPAEELAGLAASGGELYAVSAWDSWGYDTESAFGGRVWRADGTRFEPVGRIEDFRDRPSALAVVPGAREGDLEAVVLFDNDAEAGSPWRPNATVVQAATLAPPNGAWAAVEAVERLPDSLPLALNGFDLRWFARDHRLSQMAWAVARDHTGSPGAWTRALGGRWQMEVGGSIGMWARSLAPRSPLGRSRQAVAVTDYANAGLRFTRYRVRLSVVPRDRERANPSVAELLERARDDYALEVQLPHAAEPGAGVVLQGFAIDTRARAAEGICLAGLDLGASLAAPDRLRLQSTLVGGLCNDFDNRGPTLRHGRTTANDGGVSVILELAVVEGASARESSVAVWDSHVPAPPNPSGPRDALAATTDALARASLHCAKAEPAGFTALPRHAGAPPASWHTLGHATTGELTGQAGSLRGFSLAWDPQGFSPGSARPLLSDDEARTRNNYVYRYLVRAFVGAAGTFVEGGVSHGIHKSGLMRDNAKPSALYTRVDLTTFASLSGAAPYDLVGTGSVDPNSLPEDAFVRWATPFPLLTEPKCSPGS